MTELQPSAVDLTPYDTGARCEPKVWLPHGTTVTEATPAENFGKVDFDDDEAHTVATIHLECSADGRYTVHVLSHVEDAEIKLELGLRDGPVLVQPGALA